MTTSEREYRTRWPRPSEEVQADAFDEFLKLEARRSRERVRQAQIRDRLFAETIERYFNGR